MISKQFSPLTSRLSQLNLAHNKIQSLPENSKYFKKFNEMQLKVDLEWDEPSRVDILKRYDYSGQEQNKTSLYVGGLSPLFNAVRDLERNNDTKVVFLNDGQYPIYKQSGFQLHAHGTGYADYSQIYLFKRIFKSNIPNGDDHSRLDYDVFTLPIVEPFLRNPLKFVKEYAILYGKQMYQDITTFTNSGIGPRDVQLTDGVYDSLRRLREISGKMEKSIGKKIVTLNGRYYFDYDLKEMKDKQKKWDTIGIPTHRLTQEEMLTRTLFKHEHIGKISAFGMYGNGADLPPDGQAVPDIMERVIEYLQKEYPERFTFIEGSLRQISYDKDIHHQVREVQYVENQTQQLKSLPLSRLKCSLGNNQVFQEGSNQNEYHEMLAVAISLNFVLKIPMKNLVQRRTGGHSEPSEIRKFIVNNGLLPCGDMYNLHMSILDADFIEEGGEEVVCLYVRSTQGANFNASSPVALKEYAENLLMKVDYYFEGKIELVSVGSCTRKTSYNNMPEIHGDFLYGQSGVGLSFCGCDYEDWKR